MISPFRPLEFDFKLGKMVSEEVKLETEPKKEAEEVEDDFSMMGIEEVKTDSKPV